MWENETVFPTTEDVGMVFTEKVRSTLLLLARTVLQGKNKTKQNTNNQQQESFAHWKPFLEDNFIHSQYNESSKQGSKLQIYPTLP